MFCDSCNLCLPERVSFETHVSSKHSKSDEQGQKCQKCDQNFKTIFDLEQHDATEHGESEVSKLKVNRYNCEICLITFQIHANYEKHMEEIHSKKRAVNTKTYCDQCEYSCDNVADFIAHLQRIHNNPELISCKHCDYKALNKDKLYDHIENEHVEYAMLASVTSSQADMNTNFNQFKDDLTNILNKIVDTINKINEKQTKISNDQNEIKQELFILRQANYEQKVKSTKVDDIVTSEKVVTDEEKVQRNTIQPRSSTPSTFSPLKVEKSSPKIKNKPNITWIGTSESKVLNREKLETNLNANVSIVDAYCIEEENNFGEIVPEVLKKEDTDVLVLQTDSIEITNIGVEKALHDGTKSITEYQKEWYMEAELNSEKLFNIAENATVEKSDLNVIIVKRLPRFDIKTKDTLGIKKKL